MKKLDKYNYYLYIALRICIGVDIIYHCKDNLYNLIVFFSLFIFIIINDYLRREYFYKYVKRYYFSISLSMLISLIIALKFGGYIDIYLYIILYELILFTDGKMSRIFITLDICIFLILVASRFIDQAYIRTMQFWKENILDIVMLLIGLFFYCLTLFTYKALGKEKRKVEKLNKELAISYNKLKEQSDEIKQLTITKERNRVAGEIHDNLGHSLIALNMNLDVADKIIDNDIDKAKKLIHKSQMLTKESMENLRKAVYALKEERPTGLKESIKKIVENIESTGEIEVVLSIDEQSEELLPEYKEIIYSTIKEALTNSIKHGKSNKICVEVHTDSEKVELIISDNGIGCNSLVKGNGLIGIEDRVKCFGGEMLYNSMEKQGFKLYIILWKVN